jgi:quercetin dioxygenase-like cupin family protein
MRRSSLLALLVAWALTGTMALATPSSNVVATSIARATFGAAINTGQMAGLQSVIQQLTIAPGGHTGWHTHPGGTVILVQAGTFSIYNNTCTETVIEANRGVVEPGGQVQLARNEGTVPLQLTVVYFDVPVGGAVRSDAATPACAMGEDANNLPEGAMGSGVTFPPDGPGGIIQRATFASSTSITAGAERDVFVQHQSYAPGGHSGWHSHPGETVIYVESGTLSFYTEDCVRQTFNAGQGVVEPEDVVQLARNEGTVPLVLRVVYFDVPVGGSPRIDEPEPSTCTGLVGGTTPSPTPTAQPTATPAPTARPTATPGTLPGTSTQTGDAPGAGSAAVVLLAAVTSVAGFALVGRLRRRRGTG